MRDLLINLLASVIAGTAVWLGGYFIRYRRRARQQAFFGLTGGGACLLAAPRHFSSNRDNSVHRRDVAALVELATVARECGARADLAGDRELAQEFGRQTEFCVGGPTVNPRTATHLRTIVPGVTYPPGGSITVGEDDYAGELGVAEYVLVARGRGPAGGQPVFLLAGQTARSNLAAARHLSGEHRALFRRYGADRPFCLVLRVVEPDIYGTDYTELAADVTAVAFQARPVG